MIELTLGNGNKVYVNPLLIRSVNRPNNQPERAEAVVTMSDGHEFWVLELPENIIADIGDIICA